MKPARFDYACPDTLDEALALLAEEGPAARVMAGGQSLAAMLNMRLVEPRVVLDISRLHELAYITANDLYVEVGAAVTQRELLAWPALADKLPLIAQMLPHVGHTQTRARGTVCGSLAHADPSSELPLALALLNGEVVLQSRTGIRTLAARAFHTGLMTTAVEPFELIRAVRFPVLGDAAVTAFTEVSQRHGDFALTAVALTGDRRRIRIGVAGVEDRPKVLDLLWRDDASLQDEIQAKVSTMHGSDDIHASGAYRRDLVPHLAMRLIEEARDALSAR
ncbi:MAG: FAD binding domain-containing protein [Pseudomonadota bacterium]